MLYYTFETDLCLSLLSFHDFVTFRQSFASCAADRFPTSRHFLGRPREGENGHSLFFLGGGGPWSGGGLP